MVGFHTTDIFSGSGGIFIMMSPGVSAMVSIRRSLFLVGTQVISVNRHLDRDRSPPACRRGCCYDWRTVVAVWRSTCMGVSEGRLHIIVLSSMYPTMCCRKLISFVTSVN